MEVEIKVDIDHKYCRTKQHGSDMWECMGYGGFCCPNQKIYGLEKICTHVDRVVYSVWCDRTRQDRRG